MNLLKLLIYTIINLQLQKNVNRPELLQNNFGLHLLC